MTSEDSVLQRRQHGDLRQEVEHILEVVGLSQYLPKTVQSQNALLSVTYPPPGGTAPALSALRSGRVGENRRRQGFARPLNDQGDAVRKKWRPEPECLRNAQSTWRPCWVTQTACALTLLGGPRISIRQRPGSQCPALRRCNHD